MPEKRPNVLIVCADEMRADHMGCAGNGIVRTPNLDRLAARGTRFARAHCNNPICMPARATMFTGLMPRDHGTRVNGQGLRRDLPTLPGALAAGGYRTHSAGKLHLTPWVPKVDPPEPDRFPESLRYWDEGHIDEFPTPYYGFETVDFVGGHVGYAYGEYIRWLEARGGDRKDLCPDPDDEGLTGPVYRVKLPEELHYNRYIADSTISLIEDSAGGDRPFFAWCSFPDPHAPFGAPAPYATMYDPDDMPLPSRREGELDDLPPVYADVFAGELKPNGMDNSRESEAYVRRMIAMTYGMVSHLDAELGRVLDALDRTGQAENTIVVFIADHGDMMGDHGLFGKAFYTFAGCVRIPLIVADPRAAAGGRVCDALVSQIDLMPSILAACGVELPGSEWTRTAQHFQRGAVQPLDLYPGRDWAPLLSGDAGAETIRDEVVIENDDPSTGFRVRALVTDTHRLTIYPGTPHGELYDLSADPDELENLWYRPCYAELRAGLTARLLDAYARTTPWYPVPPWNS